MYSIFAISDKSSANSNADVFAYDIDRDLLVLDISRHIKFIISLSEQLI